MQNQIKIQANKLKEKTFIQTQKLKYKKDNNLDYKEK